VVGFSEHSNKPLGSIHHMEFLANLKYYQLLKMDSVPYHYLVRFNLGGQKDDAQQRSMT
jgi:hypothetical protein